MATRKEKERRINRKENRRFLITTFIAVVAIAALITSTYFLYKNYTRYHRISDIEQRLDKLEKEIYKPEPDSLEPFRETRYIDSSISNIQ